MLIKDARRVLLRAWSVRLALLSALLSATEVGMQYFAPEHPSPRFAIASFCVALASAVARIVAQPKMWRS